MVAVVLAACGPQVGGGDDEHGSEGDTSGTDPSASASGSGSASASATESGSASASATTTDSGSATASTDSGSSDDATATATVTFTEDGPPPPEGGEIGESGDCSCCGSSLHVTWDSGAIGFALTMSSPTFPEFVVTCPDATVAGLDDVDVDCGAGEVTLSSDGLAHEFGEETWTVRFEDLLPTDQQPAECEYGPSCDCNCLPSSCELVVHEPNDG